MQKKFTTNNTLALFSILISIISAAISAIVSYANWQVNDAVQNTKIENLNQQQINTRNDLERVEDLVCQLKK